MFHYEVHARIALEHSQVGVIITLTKQGGLFLVAGQDLLL